MSTIKAAVQVEILNNGQHIGYAEVSEGKWSFNASYLSPGTNTLVARYETVQSLPRQFSVVELLEDFSTAPLGYFTQLTLSKCEIISTLVSSRGLTRISDLHYGGAALYVQLIHLVRGTGVATITLNDVCSEIFWRGHESNYWAENVARIEVLSKDGDVLDLYLVPIISEGSLTVDHHFRASQPRTIKAVRIHIGNANAGDGSIMLRFDDFKVVR